MKKFAFCLIVAVLPFLSGCTVEKEKLHGAWIYEDGPNAASKGTVFDFGSDGKMRGGQIVDGKPVTKEIGSWSVNGKILTIKANKEGQARIVEVTDDKLVLKDDAEAKNTVFKRLK